MRKLSCIQFILVGLILSGNSSATPCDCSVKLGSCNAFSVADAGQPAIRSTTNQCSFVTYELNGNPSSTTVIDGIEHLRYLGEGLPSISVKSCDVCKDTRFSTPIKSLERKTNDALNANPSWANGLWRNGFVQFALNPGGTYRSQMLGGSEQQIRQGTYIVVGRYLILTLPNGDELRFEYDPSEDHLIGERFYLLRPNAWNARN